MDDRALRISVLLAAHVIFLSAGALRIVRGQPNQIQTRPQFHRCENVSLFERRGEQRGHAAGNFSEFTHMQKRTELITIRYRQLPGNARAAIAQNFRREFTQLRSFLPGAGKVGANAARPGCEGDSMRMAHALGQFLGLFGYLRSSLHASAATRRPWGRR